MVDDESPCRMAIDEAVPGPDCPAQQVDRKSWRTAAYAIRSRPRSFGSRLFSFVSRSGLPTAPGVFFQSATTSAHVRIYPVDRFGDGDPAGMGPLHFHGIAGVVAVHGKG